MRAWIGRIDPAAIGTTVVTITEIQCGIERQRPSSPTFADAVQVWLDRLIALGAMPIHTLDTSAALLLGRMVETPALRNFVVSDPSQKRPKTAADLAIAAIAISRGATVASGNESHFETIDACFKLPGLYNPFTDAWVRGAPVA